MPPPLCGGYWKSICACPPTGRPCPPNGPGRTGGTRVYPPLCGGSGKVDLTRSPHEAPLSPRRPRQDRRDSGVSGAVWGEIGDSNVHGPPRGVAAQARPEGLRCIRRCVGGTGNPYAPGLPTGRPYPRNGPGRTGGTRVHPPLCGGQWEGQTYPTPPRGAPIPKRPKQDRRDSGASAAVGEGGDGDPHAPCPPTRRPYPPNGLGKTRGTRVYPPLCGGIWKVKHTRPPPRGVPIPQTAQAGPEGRKCIRRCVGGKLEIQTCMAPHGASLSHVQPRQGQRDSGVSAAVWGGVEDYQTLPWRAPIPQPAQAGPVGLGCFRRCVGRAVEVLTLCPYPPPFIENSGLEH